MGAGLNAAALRSVVAMIELAPERWNQGAFWTTTRRGNRSAHCLAGWTCRLAGLDLKAMLRVDPVGNTVYFTAMDLLGLSTAQAGRLFLHLEDDEGRHPTVDQLKARITRVTGVDFPVPVVHPVKTDAVRA